ncbi:hypothetical protein PLAN_70053 [Planktothrix rubescens CCAP 1459/22]|uniref:Uncharacterized protein n=1 Tax=Planktothrix rubescens CCAP 1459/22 TaxID=329571 RepID=A0A6J7ZSV6_PLARU|nr:hypothetical protein PLAN_70053 [Planktothrix rubescens NIVA-CYA 18]
MDSLFNLADVRPRLPEGSENTGIGYNLNQPITVNCQVIPDFVAILNANNLFFGYRGC